MRDWAHARPPARDPLVPVAMAVPVAAPTSSLIAPVVPTTATIVAAPTPAPASVVATTAASRGRVGRPSPTASVAPTAGLVAAAGRRLGQGGEPEAHLKILAGPRHLRFDRLVARNGTQAGARGCLAQAIRGRSYRIYGGVRETVAELEGDRCAGDRVARAVGELHDQGLRNRLAHRTALAVTADDGERRGITGAGQCQVVAAAGDG